MKECTYPACTCVDGCVVGWQLRSGIIYFPDEQEEFQDTSPDVREANIPLEVGHASVSVQGEDAPPRSVHIGP